MSRIRAFSVCFPMPIQRPGLKLNLPPLNMGAPAAHAPAPSSADHLRANMEGLRQQVRAMPPADFREAQHAPDYAGMRQSGFACMSHGFMLSSGGQDVFMHARREQAQNQGEFAGDKFHLSVRRDLVPQAFQALSGLLFSESSPIDKWKVTDMARVEPEARVGAGAQLTLYVKPDGADSHYSAQGLSQVRQFVERLETTLAEHGIEPGQHPESDVRPENWRYASYRNELRSGREGGDAQSQALREEPFYRLMTE